MRQSSAKRQLNTLSETEVNTYSFEVTHLLYSIGAVWVYYVCNTQRTGERVSLKLLMVASGSERYCATSDSRKSREGAPHKQQYPPDASTLHSEGEMRRCRSCTL